MRIAVAGGTGVLGRLVVEEAGRRGHEPVALSRGKGVDLVTGVGLDLSAVDAVIDVANVETMSRIAATRFFEKVTGNLQREGARAGVGHLVAVSIVGVDRVPFGYYRGKLRQEELTLAGPVPATVLRATQFHEFAGQLLDRAKGPVAALPRMRSQTVAAREVAQHLVDLAEGPPQGLAPELAGPDVHDIPALARRVLEHQGRRRKVVAVPIPGRAGRMMATDGLLPTGPGPRGTQTFDEWLASQP